MFPYEWPFFEEIRAQVDPGARHLPQPGSLPDFRAVHSASPDNHPPDLASHLLRAYFYLEGLARAGSRLPGEIPLVDYSEYTVLRYDIFSPLLHRFIEIDERQHFSSARLAWIKDLADSPIEANYPPYFWNAVFDHVRTEPSSETEPLHRDEQRAYLDFARDVIPPFYRLKPTLRVDQFSITDCPSATLDWLRSFSKPI